MDWQGKKILIIGINGGIGKEFAIQLSKNSAEVFGTYRRMQPEESFVAEENLFKLDLEDKISELDQNISEILQKVEPDLVIFAAGSAYYGSFAQMNIHDIEHIYQVDLVAPAIISRAVLGYFLAKGMGDYHIVSAIAGLMPAIKNMAVYSSAKFGLVGLARSLAMECVGTKVKISVSCPAGVLTPLPQNAMGDKEGFLKLIQILQKNFEEPKLVVEGILDSLENRDVVVLPTEKAKGLYKK
jgi:3-oxoacyl-[acyl-carrier protein] reductase